MSIFVSNHEIVNASRSGQRPRPRSCPLVVETDYAAFSELANSALDSWPAKNTRSPPIRGNTASTSSPVEVLPVASLTQPIRYGPPKPARLPIELISAIAPAAAVPDSQAVGSVQNTPKVQNTPIAATVSTTMVMTGSLMVLEAANANAVSNSGAPTCRTRSREASECRAHRIIAMVPNT